MSIIWVYVNNIGPPVISFITNSTVSLEGNNVNLTCKATNDPDAVNALQVHWYKGDIIIKDDGSNIVEMLSDKNRTIKSVLLFEPVNHSHDGVYRCRAFNHPLSYSEAKVNLTVECKFHLLAVLIFYVLLYYI